MSKRLEQHVWITKLAGAVAVGAVSVALVGCGGSSSSGSSTQAAAPASHPQKTAVSSNLDTGVAQAQGAGAASESGATSESGGSSSGSRHATQPSHGKQGDVTRGQHTQRAATNPATSDDHNAPITLPNPCKLVSLSEAKTITDGAISGTAEAPLGPTCVYKLQGAKGAKGDITLALESSSLSQATKHMTRRHEITVKGRHGLCGKLGSQMVYVPVPGGQVLHITAPCGLGQQFAAFALGRLSA
jgi:hypothetical protein